MKYTVLECKTIYLFSSFFSKAELNTKISNSIFSNVQAIADKAHVDYKRVYKYSLDDLDELKVRKFT
jgi:hypothetical protein